MKKVKVTIGCFFSDIFGVFLHWQFVFPETLSIRGHCDQWFYSTLRGKNPQEFLSFGRDWGKCFY